MPVTYALADLHGRYDLLLRSYMILQTRCEPGLIVHLGDYIDRGPSSRSVIEWLMDPATIPRGWTRKCLKGNHEDIMCQAADQPAKMGWWFENGGNATAMSYGAQPGAHPADYFINLIPKEHYFWMNDLPVLHVDKHRIFVHAGLNPGLKLERQTDQEMMWMTYCPYNKWGEIGVDVGFGDKHVVHGHHQFADGPKLLKHRTNLDTFAWHEGRIVWGVFDDDKPGGPVDVIEVKV